MNRSVLYMVMLFFALTGCYDNDPNYNIDLNVIELKFTGRDGCPDAEYSNWENSKYVLPFPIGVTHRVDLSHCSLFNHAPGEIDQFAIDFLMPFGSKISAVREGLVVFIDDGNEDFEHITNIIVIHHSDDTYSQYFSIQKDGALLEVGELVATGQLIALSGANGPGTHPHLHFIVTKGGFAYPYEGIPVNFSNTAPNPLSLDSFRSYTALPY